jgi:hypothetical protein
MEKTFSLLDMLKDETDFEKNTQISNPKKSKEKQTSKVNEDSLSFLDFLKAEEEKLPKKSEKSGKRKLSGEDDLLSLFDILKTEEPKSEKKSKPKPKPEKNKKTEEDGEMLSLFDILKAENEPPSSKKKNSKKVAPKKQLTSELVSNATKSLNKVKKQEKSDKTDEELSLSDFLKNAEKTPKSKESFFKRRTSKKDIKEPEDTGDMFSLMDILKTEKVEDKKKRKESFSSSFFVRTKTIGTNNHNDSMILGKKTKSWGSIRQEKPLERKNSQSKKETPTVVIKPEEEIPVTPRTKRNSIKLTNFIFKDEEPGTTPVVPSTPRTKRNSIKLTNFVLKDEEPGSAPVAPSTPRSKRNSIRLPNFVFKERDESPEPSGLLSPTGTIERKKHETLISVFGAKKKESKMDLNVSGSNSTPTLATSEDSETDSNSTHKDDHEEEIKKKILGSRSNCLYIFNTKLLLKCFHLNFVLLIQYVPNTSKIV